MFINYQQTDIILYSKALTTNPVILRFVKLFYNNISIPSIYRTCKTLTLLFFFTFNNN